MVGREKIKGRGKKKRRKILEKNEKSVLGLTFSASLAKTNITSVFMHIGMMAL